MNPFRIITYQLYLLQLENYELGRYWELLFKKGILPFGKNLRKRLVWTVKARTLFAVAISLHVLAAAGVAWLGQQWGVSVGAGFATALVVFFAGYFIFFTIAEIVLYPADAIAKHWLVRKARKKIQSLPKLKIIGIAGSYGKTTMKEVLLEVLGSKLNVVATPESVNTSLGIARWVLSKFDGTLDVAVVEMGEHYPGDVKYLCGLVRPDVAVVTGINEAHLERLGNLDAAVGTIFEITENAKADAAVFLNGDDRSVKENYKAFAQEGQKQVFYRAEDLWHKKFDAERLVWETEADGVGKIEIPLLGEYALGTVSAAVQVGKMLGLTDTEIKMGLLKIKPIEHRLQPIRSAGNVLVIDDSYNGNPTGVAEAVKVLKQFTVRRKIYITPGLVESGEKVKEVHEEIGRQLAGVADVVILIENSVTPFIETGVVSRRSQVASNKPEIIWFSTAQEAHENLKNILQPGDVVLFQNDWGDQYV